jgi:hypothetical protein
MILNKQDMEGFFRKMGLKQSLKGDQSGYRESISGKGKSWRVPGLSKAS